jgi:hypothetical protein
MEKLKNSTQGIESGEWLGFFCFLVVNPSPKFYTFNQFWPSVGTSLQKGMEIPKDLKVYSIRSYFRLMILFKERKGLTCISRWVRIGVKIGAQDTNFKMSYGALENLAFDSEIWNWNGQVKLTKYNVNFGR